MSDLSIGVGAPITSPLQRSPSTAPPIAGRAFELPNLGGEGWSAAKAEARRALLGEAARAAGALGLSDSFTSALSRAALGGELELSVTPNISVDRRGVNYSDGPVTWSLVPRRGEVALTVKIKV